MNWLKVVVHKVFYPDSWDELWDNVRYLAVSKTALRKSKEELMVLRAELQSLRLEVVRLKKASAESEMHSADLERQPELGQAANQRLEELIRRLQIESAGTGETEEGFKKRSR